MREREREVNRTTEQWKKLRNAMEKHTHHFQSAQCGLHLMYFLLVAFQGPYHIAAGACLIVGIIAYALHIEIEV